MVILHLPYGIMPWFYPFSKINKLFWIETLQYTQTDLIHPGIPSDIWVIFELINGILWHIFSYGYPEIATIAADCR
jgi:hypothetical protein